MIPALLIFLHTLALIIFIAEGSWLCSVWVVTATIWAYLYFKESGNV